MEHYLIFLLTFLCLLTTAYSLQCYKCNRQHWNWGPCTTDIEVCRPFQDACTTYTAFTLPTYFTPRGERHHEISKGCDTQEGCLKRMDAVNEQTCGRTSFDDWSCIECCTGDLCNYFTTLTGSSIHYNMMLTLIAAVISSLLLRLVH